MSKIGAGAAGIINSGSIYQSPTSGDASLLSQQIKYAGLCNEAIQSDVSREHKILLTILSQSVPMTIGSAQAYFPNVTADFWSSNVIDWLAGYNLVLAAI